MINFIEKGDVLDYTAAAAVKSGAAVVLVNHIGVACGDIALGKTGAVNVSGVYELAAETGAAPPGHLEVTMRLSGAGIDHATSTFAAIAGVTAVRQLNIDE